MIAVVFGIPGVGKTSVVNAVTERIGLTYIHPGQLMYEEALRRQLVENVDQIRKLKLGIQHDLQDEMTRMISKLIQDNPDKNYIIDTHAIVKTPQGYFPGMRNLFFEIIKADIFLVVESDPRKIWERRVKDTNRERNDDKALEDIILHLDLTRSFAAAYAVKTQSNFAVIQNIEGNLDHAVNEMSEMLEKFIAYQ